MKNKIALAAAAMVVGSSLATAEIVINDFLSFEGFVDMSYTHTDTDTFSGGETNANSFEIDQVEISWLFDFDPVTAQIDVEYEDNSGNGNGGAQDTGAIEQAFVTYQLDNGGALTAGRYASMLGFEAFEPTGLYQYSVAYTFANNVVATPGYAQGVKYTQEGDMTFFGISVQDTSVRGDSSNFLGGSNATDGYGVEVAGAYHMDNGLTFFLGGAYEDQDEWGDAYVINSYVSFETGAWIFAGELNYAEMDPDGGTKSDGVAGLVMANFAYSDAASITGRVSFFDQDGDQDGIKYTLAHGYAFTDNLFMVTEVSFTDEENVNQDQEVLAAAVELLFTF